MQIHPTLNHSIRDFFLPQKLTFFAYFVTEKSGFWIFDGKHCHHFLQFNNRFAYVRTSRQLPPGAFGQAIEINTESANTLDHVARKNSIKLTWFRSTRQAEDYEITKTHPQYVFGLSQPAAAFHNDSSDPFI
ncbi:MAG: hypothetical protein CVU39_27765 [Chloroflexi bacterium HGW-Chloroflexi-10]|nr:MAG: hypothetical protein CVU39_27765 [Chloroflexi bacterium HGW-Chloroflexi-10]